MWYVSGNRDEEVIEKPDEFIIDRARPRTAPVVRLRHPPLRRHAAGRAAAEDHLGGDAEALHRIEVVGEPKRVYSSFVRGIESLPVRIPA